MYLTIRSYVCESYRGHMTHELPDTLDMNEHSNYSHENTSGQVCERMWKELLLTAIHAVERSRDATHPMGHCYISKTQNSPGAGYSITAAFLGSERLSMLH